MSGIMVGVDQKDSNSSDEVQSKRRSHHRKILKLTGVPLDLSRVVLHGRSQLVK